MASKLTINQASKNGSINKKEVAQLTQQGVSAARIQSVAGKAGTTIKPGAASAMNIGSAAPATTNAQQYTTPSKNYGINQQRSAYDNFTSAQGLQTFADNLNANKGSIGLESIAAQYGDQLTPEQQRYLYDYAGGKGYALGDGFKEQYKDAAAFNPIGTLTQPYKPGSYNASMVDGGIGKKEIAARAAEKNNPAAAYLRIANRFVDKGGRLNVGAAKQYNKLYETKNPMVALFSNRSGYDGLAAAMVGDRGKEADRYRTYSGLKDALGSGNYTKGDSLTRLKNGSFEGRDKTMNTDYISQIGKNPQLGKVPAAITNTGGNNNNTGGNTTDNTETTPETPVTPTTDTTQPLGPGGLTGGGAANNGAAGLRRARSRMRQLGFTTPGKLFGRAGMMKIANALNS